MGLRGKGANCFDNDLLRQMWDEYEVSALSGLTGADCFHHIEGRSGEHNNSIVNAAPLLNQEENIQRHGELCEHDTKVKLFKYVLRRLASRNYNFTPEDISFIESHKACLDALIELQSETKA